ncbi:MAG TPA: aspartate ammonia-lyase [Defluviitoga sp.]|nr:aspartate ammonia-lyase [Defluviitoga sp.]HOP23750.1 aspartate ammonia-lyase [Defluviitoga sp.]HPZ28503.1 aspartate ammonia-lyase [Defluviitoga sp.]HQD62763.1 aspartate ammonia-lyase [Defluviitoga sp.]
MSRIERDSLGEKEIENDRYYGIQSLRAKENFPISGQKVHPLLIKNLAYIKKAAALMNLEVGLLEKSIAGAIVKAANEIIEGKFLDDFIIDAIQGGAGTSVNMNINEVIANRAIELLGGKKGDYSVVHPNNHVNMSQSTNDVFPTAIKMTTIVLLTELIEELKNLRDCLKEKSNEFDEVVKVGRTQLQDAIPIRLGQEFKAYSLVVDRDIRRLQASLESVMIVNMGGTAIGTCLNADELYTKGIVDKINEVSGFHLVQAEDLIDATQNNDSLLEVSSLLKTCAVNLSKIANDLRLISSGPRAGISEINLPAVQPGSSIMPGKINPVIPEVLNQVSFQVIGNDLTITMAIEAGQLELNAMLPIVAFNLFESIQILKNAVNTFTINAIKGLTAKELRCKNLVENSLTLITALTPHLGYETCSVIAQKALKSGKNIRDVILEEGYLSENEVDRILNPYEMTKGGIVAKDLLNKKGKRSFSD